MIVDYLKIDNIFRYITIKKLISLNCIYFSKFYENILNISLSKNIY